MPASKRQMNWSPVAFTPQGGTAMIASGVTNVSIDGGGQLVKFAGDGDRFHTTVVNAMSDPTMTITSADESWLMGISPGARGSVSATHKDAKGLVGGNITYSLANAVAESPSVAGSHAAFGSGTIRFCAESADGITNPLSFTLS